MPRSRNIVVAILTLLCTEVSGQCVEYPEIEGSECFSCVLDGWYEVDPTPDVADPDSYICMPGQSPSGGNAIFFASGMSFTESVGTVVNGLTPGNEYNLALWYINPSCNGVCCASLEVVIDGETYEFDNSEEWTLIDICIEAESSTMTLEFFGVVDEPLPMFGVTYIDSAICESIDCCTPREPTFDFPLNYCATDDEVQLPTLSLEGIVGTWSVDSFLPSEHAGETLTLIFTPSNNPGCDEEIELEITVDETVLPIFDFPLIYCIIENEFVTFPMESENDIEGNWSIPEIYFDDYPNEDNLEIEFVPLANQCSEAIEINLELLESEELDFDLDISFCKADSLVFLSDFSEDGIEGNWSQNPIDLNQSVFNAVSVFTPILEDTNDCYDNYIYTYSISESIPASFNIETFICRENKIIELDSYSLDSILGTWSIPSFNPDTVTGNVMSTWTPLEGQGDCLSDSTFAFTIMEAVVPQFDIPLILCASDSTLSLPEYSIGDSITGVWSVNPIDPSLYTNTTIETVFVPDPNLCANSVSFSITISAPQEVSFDIQGIMCEQDDPLILPSISLEGVSGNWSVNPIDPSNQLLDSIVSVFTPDLTCQESYEIVIHIQDYILPEFDLPIYICNNNSVFTFPNESLNNISGSWSVSEINPNDFFNQSVLSVFTADNQFCTSSISDSIFVPGNISWDIFPFNPSDCNATDGDIDVNVNPVNLSVEFSLDGIVWQDTGFENLGQGNYTVFVRRIEYPLCIDSLETSLTAPDAPQIINIETTDLSSCNFNNGQFIINATGNDLEYSLDGLTWQNENRFEDLAEGFYTVFVQEQNTTGCASQSNAELTAPILPILNATAVLDNTNCLENNGEISVSATGENLEYSINNGATWSSVNVFEMLPGGDYTILIRDSISTDCLIEEEVFLENPESVSIVDFEIVNPSECNPNAGEVEIISNIINVEYSIDGGVSYQDENSFSGLQAGDYSIIIRHNEFQDCMDELLFTFNLEFEDLGIQLIEQTSISDCNLSDATVNIESDSTNVSFSIDGGNTLQDSGVFENLGPGVYTVLVTHNIYSECQNAIQFTIEAPECPCPDLDVSISSTPVSCLDNKNGSISLDAVEGFENQVDQISWSNGNIGPTITDLEPGGYEYTILYDNDCIWQDSVFVEYIDPLIFGLKTFDPDCEGDNDGIIEIVDVIGGNGDLNYSIDGVTFQESSVFYNLSPQEYLVQIIDEEDCLYSELIEINEGTILSLDLPQITTIKLGETIFLNPLINVATIDSFSWEPSIGILNPNEIVAQVMPEVTTEYSLIIYFGECAERRTVLVEVIQPEEKIFIPNTFSPNASGLNKFWFVQTDVNSNIELVALKVFDRWGNKVYDVLNPLPNLSDTGWDGRFNDVPVVSGVYIYYLEYAADNEIYKLVGDLTVLY